MKKNILRGLASALALAVALVAPNVAAVTAYADDETETTTPSVSVDSDDTKITITKTWTVASESQYDEDEEFTFVLEYDHADNVGTNYYATPQANNSEMSSTNTVSVTVGGTTTTDGTTTTNWTSESTTEYTDSALLSDLLSQVTFTAPGIYYFTLSETAGSNTNITYDGTTYTVVVYVTWASSTDESDNTTYDYESLAISAVLVYDSDGIKVDDDIVFKNTAATNKNLTVSKTVSGNAANTEDNFTFSVTFTGLTGYYSFTVSGEVVVKDSNGNEVTSVTNGTYTITMSHGESITFNNLPKNATYVVDETNALGYTETTPDNEKGTISDADIKVEYVNTATYTPPTGITLYLTVFGVVAVVAAAGIALVVVRRRRSYDEF